MKPKIEILTGIRPSANLTIANYIGAIAPILELQNTANSIILFVADLHALTDNEPELVKKHSFEVVADYLALGINPQKTTIFLQSELSGQLMTLTALLSRHITVAELLRVPTLKEKIKKGNAVETANSFLFLYPVLMAADILIQGAKKVPVGEDQLPHIEVAQKLAERFNKKYGDTFVIPEALQLKSVRVLSLKGEGKMSKSHPEGALFLGDSPEVIAKKIKSAETAIEGKMNEKIESHILIAKSLAKTEDEKKEIDALIKRHKQGEPIMGEFKKSLTKIVQNFTQEFQIKRAQIMQNPVYIQSILEKGRIFAKQNADETLFSALRSMGFK
ncbi:MAG TPA: tryptophan--tRNA ligase [Candidatus Pacearchaeota archaeon]|nr:tryptophan--tRNA ligase [Candidatus Pacearchaeota archaeon]HQH20449.1 tryptophan--tRNA ligase [Candidatus Pacearchaeota archaeon]HQK58694.1 tryptophan--tRNA ligase [Candidatus Pacearchaeota archaeon]